MFSWADIAIIAVCVASAAFGVWRGFAKEALSLATWLVAIFLAWKFAWVVEPLLDRWIADAGLKLWAARALILAAVLLAGGLVSWLVREVVRAIGLRSADRTLGAAFGFARGVLIVGLGVIVLELTGLDQEPWWQRALLRPLGDSIAEGIRYYGSLGGEFLREQEIA